jgi:iron complex outermembrane receptor protein
VRISHGPYDPRQGDFAIAGSAHLDLGLEQPGFLASGTLGSFGTKRVLLVAAPGPGHDIHTQGWRDSFVAFEAYSSDGPGTGRAGERASFVGQLAYSDGYAHFEWCAIVAVGTARFDFPGLLPLADVQRGAYPYASVSPLGRDLTLQAHLGNELTWEIDEGSLSVVAYLSMTQMQLHQDLTGYALDVLAGLPPVNPDDAEQVNQATTYGLGLSYRHRVQLVSRRDVIEVGARPASTRSSSRTRASSRTGRSRPATSTPPSERPTSAGTSTLRSTP